MKVNNVSGLNFNGTLDYKNKEIKNAINYAKRNCNSEDDCYNRHFINTLNFIKNDGTDNVLTLKSSDLDEFTVRISSYYGDKFVTSSFYDKDKSQNFLAVIDAGYKLFGDQAVEDAQAYPPNSVIAKILNKINDQTDYKLHIQDDISERDNELKLMKIETRELEKNINRLKNLEARNNMLLDKLQKEYQIQMNNLIVDACEK